MKKILKHKITIFILIILAVSSYFGYKYYVSTKTVPTKTQMVKVTKGDVRSAISATGTVQPVNSVDVSSKITGRIVEVRVKENDWVKAGDVLFVLDDKQYKSELERTTATLNNAAAIFERQRTLLNKGAVARQDYDIAEKDYFVAKAAYDTAVSNLEDTVITAPVAGLVVGKPTPAGQTVAPGISTPMVLMTIADMSIMQSETLVDESDIGQVSLGQEVEFTVDAYTEKTYHGKISLISRKVEQDNNINYYKVYVDVTDNDEKLFPDMTSRVTILITDKKDVLSVPVSSVKDTKNGSFVNKAMPDGSTKETKVDVGVRGNEKIEIKGGINEGDEVVLRASSNAAQQQVRTPRIF